MEHENIFLITLFSGTVRSSFLFTKLELLYSTWDETELAHQVSSMPCLIAFIRTDIFARGMQFVDKISGLNKIKSKKKYIILMTPTIDQSLLQNRTDYFDVHIINQGETSMIVSISI